MANWKSQLLAFNQPMRESFDELVGKPKRRGPGGAGAPREWDSGRCARKNRATNLTGLLGSLWGHRDWSNLPCVAEPRISGRFPSRSLRIDTCKHTGLFTLITWSMTLEVTVSNNNQSVVHYVIKWRTNLSNGTFIDINWIELSILTMVWS